ncbi:MAG: AAA family ATPase [Gammaproteobacteria bacterium]|nr:AAA family ATPase [Gammaproteobacteria bacterium]
MDKSKIIQALQSPQAYPHPVTDITLIETHISWVFLTGFYAYKIKKPLKLDFLDFSNLEKRQYYCHEELRLNRRFAPALYLDVVSICEEQESISFGGAGTVVEYAVKMRQFDNVGLLDNLAQKSLLTEVLLSKMAVSIAAFHDTLFDEPRPENQAFGSFDTVSNLVLGNFTTIQTLLDNKPDLKRLQVLEDWSRCGLERYGSKIRDRHDAGFVRECHGDLHLGNMTLLDDEVILFDCIEFNPEFRFMDVISELAFLLMDLDSRGLHSESNSVLNTYLSYRDDYDGLVLLKFYKVYFALVRAKVSLIKALAVKQEGMTNAGELDLSTFYRYLILAERYLQPTKCWCAITHGISGSGKSTVARQLAKRMAALQIRSDVERKRLFNLKPLQKSAGASLGNIYTPAVTRRTFVRLHEIAELVLDAGIPVIVDATFLSRKSRSSFYQLAESYLVPFHILNIFASDQVIRQRLQLRELKADDASEAGVEVMMGQCAVRDEFDESEKGHVININSERPLGEKLLKQLEDCQFEL